MPEVEGCKNPNAANYNDNATIESFDCLYTVKNENDCHLFADVLPIDIKDKSFTVSYSIKNDGAWVFYHDYIPDFYFHKRENLFSAKDNKVYEHNNGPVGSYYDGTKPFFIDVIFRDDGDMILEDVEWVSEFLDSQVDMTYKTITHLSIWNSAQHTTRIPLTDVFENVNYTNIRRTKGSWSFNDFKDVLKDNAGAFLKDLFENFALDTTKVGTNIPWYDLKNIQNNWFCIRFEFDNSTDATFVLHDTNVHVLKSDR